MVKKKGFNLLKNQVEPQTKWTKLYHWTTSTARVIMILVELVIVVAFGIRVVVELQFKNLNKDIAVKEDVLLALQDNEIRLRTIQNRADIYKNLWDGTDYYSNVYTELTRIVPATVQELNVQIVENELIVKGYTDTATIEQIETGFKNSPQFRMTELLNVETQGQSLDSFTLKTRFNNLPKRSDILF